jgi:hypothetical protein
MNDSAFPHRFRATSESLVIARQIADAVGAPFDPESTKQVADKLHNRYFSDIKRTVGLDIARASFRSGSRYRVNAFVPTDSDVVHFDEVFDHWLFTLCHLTTIAACKQLSGKDYKTLIEHFVSALDMTRNAHVHRSLRHEVLPLLLTHADCLELSHALSRAMIVFVICHECAHITLGHTAMQPCPENEFQADHTASGYFDTIVNAKEEAGSIYVSHKLTCAPVLLFQSLRLAECRTFTETGRAPTRETHPSPRQRIDQLSSTIRPKLSEHAGYILSGFTAAIADIERLAELREPPE